MKWLVTVGLAAIILLLLPAFVQATPTSPAALNILSSSSRQLSQVSNGSIEARGGNVTQVNIDALTITKSWQGYYGNITGNVRLDDANNQSFYVWGNATPAGEVFATRNSTIQWTTVNCTTASQRAAEETYLGQTAADGDSATNTFNSTNHPSVLIGMSNITQDSCYSTNVFANGSAQTTNFYQMMLSDNSSNILYTTIISSESVGFNGQTVDFQLLVGENEHPGGYGVTNYYFFVELN